MAMLPLLPQVIAIDTNGNLASYLDDETGEIHLMFYVMNTDDPMSPFATHVVKVALAAEVIEIS